MKSSSLRLESCPSSGGSLPFSTNRGGTAVRANDVTRCGVPSSVIPFQFNIAVDAFQFRKAVPRRVSFSPQRTLQSAMRPVFV